MKSSSHCFNVVPFIILMTSRRVPAGTDLQKFFSEFKGKCANDLQEVPYLPFDSPVKFPLHPSFQAHLEC